MKATFAGAVLAALLAAAAVPLAAQSSTAAAQSTAPSVAPGEPEIVMPQVVLQIEDLSVEKVVAQLPAEAELLPPERPVPILSEGDLVIGDPSIPAADVGTEAPVIAQGSRTLSSDITLGAGMQNRIIASMAVKTLGADPRFALSFNHETLDGFAGHVPGSGFSLRNDLLDGSLKFGLGPVDTSVAGTFNESENGLQQEPLPFVARLARSLSGTADFSVAPRDWLTLGAGVDGSYDSLTLEGSSPLQSGEFLVTPRLSAQARAGVLTFGLQSAYTFRGDTGSGLQRFTVTGSFTADLPDTFLLSGNVGWFWNDDTVGLSLVPFSVNVTGTPWQFITFSLAFGYAVQQYNLHDILPADSFTYYPGGLKDDYGWFGSGSVQFTFTRDLSATFAAAYRQSAELPTGVPAADPTTGLFVVTQAPAQELSSDVGFRWGISAAFSVSAGWHHEYMALPFFTPIDSLRAEIIGLDPAGRFGANLSVLFAPPFAAAPQQPVLRLSGFWKASDAVKLQLDADDLLGPLMGTPRWDIGPYAAPGFRVTGSLGMSL